MSMPLNADVVDPIGDAAHFPEGKSTLSRDVVFYKDSLSEYWPRRDPWVDQDGEDSSQVCHQDDKREEEEAEILYELQKLELERKLRRLRSGHQASTSAGTPSPVTVLKFPPSETLEPKPIYTGPPRAQVPATPDVMRFQNGVSTAQEHNHILTEAVARMDLPKIELVYFDGDPLSYHQFIRQFEMQVESRVLDPGQRLSFLMHYSKGRAKRAIQGCIMLPAPQGYRRARDILQNLFGKSHAVGRALMSDLVQGGPVRPTADALTEFSIKLENCEMTLCHMGHQADLDSENTIERVVKRLPIDLQRRWVEISAEIYERGRVPSFVDLKEFVARRASVYASRYGGLLIPTTFNRPSSHVTSVTESFSSTKGCSMCHLAHELPQCSKFLGLSPRERWKLVSSYRLCYKCFQADHSIKDCPIGGHCTVEGCRGNHNSLLHFTKDSQFPLGLKGKGNSSTTMRVATRVSLGVVAVEVIGPKGSHVTYALIDNGSDSTFVDENLARKIGLEGEKTSVDLQTLGRVQRVSAKRVSFSVVAASGSKTVKVPAALSVGKMMLGTGFVPSQAYLSKWSHLEGITLNDLGPMPIELLIGCNVPEAHWIEEQRIGAGDQPFATRTSLGWMLLGPLSDMDDSRSTVFHTAGLEDIEARIEKLYNTEFSCLDDSLAPSVEDQMAKEAVLKSIKVVDEHVQIGLPWRRNTELLQNNRSVAVRRLEGLERRFQKEPQLFKHYKLVIQNHFDRGYAEAIDDTTVVREGGLRWYLPHHPVINPRKPDKIRVVFDCAAKFKGSCLNDCLLQGPNPVNNLVAVLLGFREERIAVVSDIQEMFLQVNVPRHDRSALRFLWWPNHDRSVPPRDYQLTVHPFGATSSPFCANAALRHSLSTYQGSNYTAVAHAIENCFYVDDCLMSVGSLEVGEIMIRELRSTLSAVGFRLTKWMSNAASLLRLVPAEDVAKTVVDLSVCELPTEKTLGLEWDAQADTFKFTIQLPQRPSTRRGILSWVSSLFDPLGMVCPVLLSTKLLLQKLHQQGYGWDQALPEDLAKLHEACKDRIAALANVRVPRCLKPHNVDPNADPELHVFSDASEIGYGAVAYLRFLLQDGTYRCSFLWAKSRVAPTKVVSIPRLELNAAVLAVKIARVAENALRFKFSRTVFWTDSKTVIYYIINVKSRFSVFVANRLTFIREHTDVDQWNHVKTDDNVADYASRGISSNDPRFTIWLRGPRFLELPVHYQRENFEELSPPAECELRRANFAHDGSFEQPLKDLLMHYSSWNRLTRAVVWFIRFKAYLRVMKLSNSGCGLQVGPIRAVELEMATTDVVRLVQRASYEADIESLNSTGEVRRSSVLRKLTPILSRGMMVVGGRLQQSNLEKSSIHPIILPDRNHVTSLLIQHTHELEGHAGVQHTLNVMRTSYWVVKGAAVVRRVLRRCLICQRLHAAPGKQLMSTLPSTRVTPGNYAFESTGVDYFGPMQVKQGRSMVKRWGCLFTCLRTRAVHIEVAYSLTTDSFLLAFMRFIGRRGAPKEMFSDNGTNFVGADNELRGLLQSLPSGSVADKLLDYKIDWHFQPAACSHRGGVWERLIRSVRRILSAISREQVLSDESLSTFLIEVERVMNNRPLFPVYDDHTANLALTPNDILLLRPGRALIPEAVLCLDRYRKHWKQAQHLSNVFWKRWSREYLQVLQLRQKWQFKERNLQVNDVVLVATDNVNRFAWPLARVTHTYQDGDGLVRKVDIRTSKGVCTRDVRSLYWLEGVEASNEEINVN